MEVCQEVSEIAFGTGECGGDLGPLRSGPLVSDYLPRILECLDRLTEGAASRSPFTRVPKALRTAVESFGLNAPRSSKAQPIACARQQCKSFEDGSRVLFGPEGLLGMAVFDKGGTEIAQDPASQHDAVLVPF